MDGKTPHDAAATEAMEEAGVEGNISPACLGLYYYLKTRADIGQKDLRCMVAVYPLHVENCAETWPEMAERQRQWFSIADAQSRVEEPALQQIIADFAPPSL